MSTFSEKPVTEGHSRMTSWPFVSVVMPVRNEAGDIENTLRMVLGQDYPPDRYEVIVADGESTDGTREIVQRFAETQPGLRIVGNPGKFVSSGLNRALAAARGEIIVRLDGHWIYPSDHVRRLVELRERTGAVNAGGVLVPTGTSYVQRSICAALSAPVGIGGGAMGGDQRGDDVREVDHVMGGCWRRDALLEAGGFSEEMVRNQDDEMSFRLRKAGGRIFQSPSIRFQYIVRNRWSKLFRQYLQYGYWKVRVIRKHPRQASPRHLAPGLLVVTLLAGVFLGYFSKSVALGASLVAVAYLVVILGSSLVASVRSGIGLWPGVALAFLLIHVGYGTGFLMGAIAAVFGGMDPWFTKLTR